MRVIYFLVFTSVVNLPSPFSEKKTTVARFVEKLAEEVMSALEKRVAKASASSAVNCLYVIVILGKCCPNVA